jgi:hypothetical protein
MRAVSIQTAPLALREHLRCANVQVASLATADIHDRGSLQSKLVFKKQLGTSTTGTWTARLLRSLTSVCSGVKNPGSFWSAEVGCCLKHTATDAVLGKSKQIDVTVS